MSNRINLEDWLVSEEGYATGTDAGDTPANVPPVDPNTPPSPNIANPAGQQEEQPDYSADPQYPDMPEEKQHKSFEGWKQEFVKSAVKADLQEMKQAILDIRDRDLDTYQRKYVEDNLQIILLREDSNIGKVSKEFKKMIKDDLDHNNPGVSLANHLIEVLSTQPMLTNTFIKMTGLYDIKQAAHRKYIAALTGSLQVGAGGTSEDLVYNEKDFSIRISTRFNARFGDVFVGSWCLRRDDPHRYLKPPELQRLEEGSPEEKDVLRRRVVMESISETFKTRAFLINVCGTDGTVYTIGWDVATSLKAAYTDGRLIVKTTQDDNSQAMIDDDGAIISFQDIKIMYAKPTGEMDEDGKPYKKEIEFMALKNGQLYLTAELSTLKAASGSFPGILCRETPYSGNPSDLKVLQRCVPSWFNILMQQCG